MRIAVLALNRVDYLALKDKLNPSKETATLKFISEEKELWGNEYNAMLETARAKEAPGYSKLKIEILKRLRAAK